MTRTREDIQAELASLAEDLANFDPSEHASEDNFRDMLDDVYGDAEIAGLTYSTSRTLEEIDPVAFRCRFNDWADSLDFEDFEEYRELQERIEELESELDDLDDDGE